MTDKDKERFRSIDVCHIWCREAAAEVSKVTEQIQFTDAQVARITSTAQSLPHKAGFAAEILHAETFNLDAIIKDERVRALTGQHPGSTLSNIDSTTDILLTDGRSADIRTQLKYYRNPEETQKALRETIDGLPKYKEADQHIVPADQLDSVKESARKTQLRNMDKRPHVVDAAREVEAKASARLELDGVHSKELSLEDAKKIASGDQEGEILRREIETEYLNASTLKHSWRAAKSAAMISTIVTGTVNTVQCLKLVQEGKMRSDDAVKYILWNTSIAAGDAALKAGAATAAVSIAAQTLPAMFQGAAFQASLATGSVASVAICTVDLVQCLVLVAAGRMTIAELEDRMGKNSLQTGSAVLGSAIGATIGAPAGPAGVYIGSVVGGMIASLSTTIAIDNHIEAPYRETLATAEALVRSHNILAESAAILALSQQAFTSFRVGAAHSEQTFSDHMQKIDAQHDAIQQAIDRI